MFSPPAGYVPTIVNPLLDHSYTDFNQLEGINRYVTCSPMVPHKESRKISFFSGPTTERVGAPQRKKDLFLKLYKNEKKKKKTF